MWPRGTWHSQDLGRTSRVKWLCIGSGSGGGGDIDHRFQGKWYQGFQPTLERTRGALGEIGPGKLSGSDWIWEVSFCVLVGDGLERDKTKWEFCHQVRMMVACLMGWDQIDGFGINYVGFCHLNIWQGWVHEFQVALPGIWCLLDKNSQLYSWCPRGWLPFKFCPDSKGWVDQEDWWKSLLSISAVYILLTFRSRLPQYELLITSL